MRRRKTALGGDVIGVSASERTSDRRRPFGKSLAMSGGSTTCLGEESEGRKRRGVSSRFRWSRFERRACTRARGNRRRRRGRRARSPRFRAKSSVTSQSRNTPRGRVENDLGTVALARCTGGKNLAAFARARARAPKSRHRDVARNDAASARVRTCTRRCRRSTSRSTESEASRSEVVTTGSRASSQ